ncbi:hypothetical protein BH24ACT5_BH24ACT5_22960 [soil metagenome]
MVDPGFDFGGAFLSEVARLLPEADVVHVRPVSSGPTVVPETDATAVDAAARSMATLLVSAWRAAFQSQPEPEWLEIKWSPMDVAGVARAHAAAHADANFPGSVNDLIVRLSRLGWSIHTRRDTPEVVNLLGRAGGDRLDVVVLAPGQANLRVTRPEVAVGASAQRLAESDPQRVRWPR